MEKKRIAILSNITVDLIKQRLSRKYEIYIPEGYDAWIPEVLNQQSGLYTEKHDAVVVLLDGTVVGEWSDYSVAQENLDMWKQGVTVLTSHYSNIPVFISTIDFRENRIKALNERRFRISMQNEWYEFVQSIAGKSSNVYVYDLADTITDIGRRQFYSDKMWYMSNMPYSREGMLAVCKVITRLMKSAFESRKKIIALDLDNTLWGGVIGEDGIEGIELADHKEGQRFYDFQRQFLEMQKRGVLLAIVSKNNTVDAEQAITKHPYMLLRDEEFAAKKINWDTKAGNIKKLESELNLTEGSFVFIDDNPAERETVKGVCPDVLVPQFPSDTTALKEFAEELYFDEFLPLRMLEEDKSKTQMYQIEAQRKQEANMSVSLDEYLAKLELTADIHRMRPDEIDRVVQLCNKTNQFNVTTKRYTREEILEIAEKPSNAIYVAYLDDKYGESGLTCILILIGDGKDEVIDTFLMSCRVMGRKLEDVIVNEVLKRCKLRSSRIRAEFIPTAKNAPVKDLFERLGFSLVGEQVGRKKYEMNLDTYSSGEFPFYKEIIFDSGDYSEE